jgi:hypothetical protein
LVLSLGTNRSCINSACCVVDQDQQRAGLAAIFEPSVFAAVDLDQLADTLTT